MPSFYHEGTPRSLLEALACGRPIIASNWKGCKDTVELGKNGFLVKEQSEVALFKAISSFLKLSNREQVAMGKFSRNKAKNELKGPEV